MNSLLLRNGLAFAIIIAVSASELRAQPGSLDTNFNAVATAAPVPRPSFFSWQTGFSVAVQPDGKVIAAGTFGVLRLLGDGSVDPAFQVIPPGPELFTGSGNGIGAVALQSDGRILVTGNFTNSAGVQLPGIFRLETDGTIDPSFNLGPGIYPSGRAIALQPDGKVVSSGNYSGPGDEELSGLFRLRSDGSLDPDFDSRGFNSGGVFALAPGGEIYVAVDTTILRVNPDGSRDETFAAQTHPSYAASALAVQFDGKLLVGSYADGMGFLPPPVRRLLRNGTDDPDWIAPSVDGGDAVVYAILVQPDGKVLVGGNNLQGFNGVVRGNLGRLNPDGSPDATFDTQAELNFHEPEDLAMAPDGKVYVAGRHLDVAGGYAPAPAISRLNNDAGPSGIEFTAPSYVVQEGDGWVNATVRRTTETGRLAVVSYSVRPGSATPWRDYFGGNGVLVFRPGETQKHIRIYVVRDRKAENYETVRLSLTRARGGNLGPQRQAILTILNR